MRTPLLALLIIAGCSDRNGAPPGSDASVDGSAVHDAATDAASDAHAFDASPDAFLTDAAADATTDATSFDAASDAHVDAPVHDGGLCDLPHAIVVKYTDPAYNDRVLIRLSADGTMVTAYPAPSDVACPGPDALADGYSMAGWVGDTVAATSYDFCSYHAFTEAPLLATLLEHVVEAHPFAEIWDCGCGLRSASELNAIITGGTLSTECSGP